MGGSGRAVIPGLFWMAVYSEKLGIHKEWGLSKEFEAQTLISLDDYLPTIYAPPVSTNSFPF
jgi:hypothetical protein